jgi:hypothetical protein
MTHFELGMLVILVIDSAAILMVCASILRRLREQEKNVKREPEDKRTGCEKAWQDGIAQQLDSMLHKIKPGDPVISRDGSIRGVIQFTEPDHIILDRSTVRINGKKAKFAQGESAVFMGEGFHLDINAVLDKKIPKDRLLEAMNKVQQNCERILKKKKKK